MNTQWCVRIDPHLLLSVSFVTNSCFTHHAYFLSISNMTKPWRILVAVTLAMLHHCPALSYPGTLDSFVGLPYRALQLGDDPPDAGDFSAVTGFGAIGGGSPYDDNSTCARGDTAYPNLMDQDVRFGESAGRTFQFLTCSRAVSQDILNQQVPILGESVGDSTVRRGQ